jgi:hypothetical protein
VAGVLEAAALLRVLAVQQVLAVQAPRGRRVPKVQHLRCRSAAPADSADAAARRT